MSVSYWIEVSLVAHMLFLWFLVIEKLLSMIACLVHMLKTKYSGKYSFFRIVSSSNKCALCFTTEQVTKGIFANEDSENEYFETSSNESSTESSDDLGNESENDATVTPVVRRHRTALWIRVEVWLH